MLALCLNYRVDPDRMNAICPVTVTVEPGFKLSRRSAAAQFANGVHDCKTPRWMITEVNDCCYSLTSDKKNIARVSSHTKLTIQLIALFGPKSYEYSSFWANDALLAAT